MIYQFKVALKDVGVPVWRRLQLDSESTFEDFHYSLMAAFDWLGYHLHEFDIRKTNGTRSSAVRIGSKDETPSNLLDSFPDPFRQNTAPSSLEYPRFFEEKDIRISDWFKKEKDRALYTYDFGDNWEHVIVLEKIVEADPNTAYPLCLKAKNDTPLEDSRIDSLNEEIDLTNPNWKLIVENINDTFRSEDWKEDFLSREDFI
ncbi:MAG: plasmid pRiA4b ORF-3 family protein [Alkalibacterium sp.]|nr:plasmid pRiA4b ORF-3 family protein [Alkalibacterium sp.]